MVNLVCLSRKLDQMDILLRRIRKSGQDLQYMAMWMRQNEQ